MISYDLLKKDEQRKLFLCVGVYIIYIYIYIYIYIEDNISPNTTTIVNKAV